MIHFLEKQTSLCLPSGQKYLGYENMWQQNRLHPFEDEYNQGQLSQHILKQTKPETPQLLIMLCVNVTKKTLEAHLTDHVARIVNHYLAHPISPLWCICSNSSNITE
jgi:hypothetical protein